MTEFVGMQEIANAAGVTYHQLWLAVRTHAVTLRIDVARSGKPYVANAVEVRTIRSRIKPDCTPSISTQTTTDQDDPDLQQLGDAVKLLEKRLNNL